MGDSILLVVADGMGGHADGDVAAQVLTDTLSGRFDGGGASDDPANFLDAAIRAAHREVHRIGIEMHLEERPRTTCSAAVVHEGAVWWAHVGDSRIYLFRNRKVAYRTRDHSHVETLLRSGEISADEADDHPLRNWVERSVGGERDTPDIEFGGPENLTRGDTVLLCSDGFWEPLDEDAVGEYLAADRPLEEILEDLVKQAIAAAEPVADNATATALRVTP